jgi:RecB family exonuclease
VVVVADADAESWPDARLRAELVPPELLDRLTEASDPALRPIVQCGPAAVVARLALATTRAERLIFTYRVRDDDGEGRSPAALVASLGDRARTTVWRAEPTPHRPLSERDWRLGELARVPGLSLSLAPHADRRARIERLREESFNCDIGAQHPLFPTLPRGEPFLSILTEETGGGTRPLAAIATDGLAACLFKGFVGEVVRARRPREAHDVADARELGQIIHAAVEAAFRATASLWAARPRDEDEVLRVGLLAAERVLAPERRGSALARAGAPAARKAVRAVLEWSLADLTWDFACAEQPFGEEGAWDAVVLEGDGRKLALRGRIDRVDVAHEGSAVRVIDYKKAATAHTTALGTTKFQLLLYGRAAQTGLARSRTEGLYLAAERLRIGALPSLAEKKWADAHEIVVGMPRFERRLLDLVGQLRRGDLSVRPHSLASCTHCDFDGVCRKPRFTPPPPTEDGGDPEEVR